MELMDEYLDQLGLWRKQIPKDPSCLFRICSEFLYGTQVNHQLIREECSCFMKTRKTLFENCIDGEYKLYLENLVNPKVYGGQLEMHAMSLLYKVNFEVYEDSGKDPVKIANSPNFEDVILLCYTLNNNYDVIYPKSRLSKMAFCQSLVYTILYQNAFGLGEDVNYAVQKMLYDKEYAKQKKTAYNARGSKPVSSW